MKTILVIQHDEQLRENTAELLALHNYNVVTAETGDHGLEMAIESRPDIILMDLMLPPTRGEHCLKILRESGQARNTPIVIFSAGTVPIGFQSEWIREDDAYIGKPFTEEELLNAIEGIFLAKSQSKPKAAENMP